MTNINITPILEAIVSLCVILITRYLIPYLKHKAGKERTARIMEVAGIAVRAAEKMYDTNAEKLAFVLDELRKRGYDFSADELRTFAEAAVYEIKDAAQNEQALDAETD